MATARRRSSTDLRDSIEALSRRLYFSNKCIVFHTIMVLLNLTVIVWVCADHKGHPANPLFLALEVIVTFLLVLEVTVRLITLRKKFWHECCNVFDFVVAVLCIVSVIFYLSGPSKSEEVEDVVAESSLLVRNALQCIRMLLALRAARSSHKRRDQFQLDIDLDDLGDMDLSEFSFDLEETEKMLAAEDGKLAEDSPLGLTPASSIKSGPSTGGRSAKSSAGRGTRHPVARPPPGRSSLSRELELASRDTERDTADLLPHEEM